MADTVLRLNDVRRLFDVSAPWLARLLSGTGPRTLKAVDGVSFEIGRGETFALVGESGCGKSTVARLVVGLYDPSSGSIEIDGTDIASLKTRAAQAPVRRRVQMVFQDPYASLNPRFRVDAIVSEPIRAFDLIQGERNIQARVGELLSLVGLHADDGLKYPHQFSGGQRQRILIAMALANRPQLLIADEPTTALDVTVQAQVLQLLRDLQQQFGLAMLFISHDLAVVAEVADRVAVMRHGWLLEQGSREQIFHTPRHPYTRSLLGAVPTLETDRTLPLSTLPSATDVRPGPLVEYDIGHQARALS